MSNHLHISRSSQVSAFRVLLSDITEKENNVNNQSANRIERVLLPSLSQDGDEEMCYSDNDREDSNEKSEEDAFLAFFEKFDAKYGTDHINFQYCTLKEAISFSCPAPGEYGNVLALYLHNEFDVFSQEICPHFVKGKLRHVLEKSFDVLAWDLLSDTDSALELAIDEWPNLQIIKTWIKKKRAGLFILNRDKNSVYIFSEWHGSSSLFDILLGLEEIEAIFFNTEEQNEEIGPVEYQQRMCDNFCDRDYIIFEPSEHDLLKKNIGISKFGFISDGQEYSQRQKTIIEKTYEVIRAQSNKCAEWDNHIILSIIFNCLVPLGSKKKTDIISVPVYVIPKCMSSSNPCRVIIDHDNRVYYSWTDYVQNNKLPKGLMVLPTEGRYGYNEDYKVNLTTYRSPACSGENAILNGVDTLSSVVGTGSGTLVIATAISGITIAPAVVAAASISGLGAGLYSIVRSAMNLHDRRMHCESLRITNAEARNAYFNIFTGSLSFTSIGASTAISQLAGRGVKIGMGVQTGVNVLNVVNVGTNAAGVLNSSYDILDNWDKNKKLSKLSILQFSTSLLFFGHAVYNFRTATTIINEAQYNEMTSLRKSLHRTVKNERAEVIKGTSRFYNKDGVYGFLKRYSSKKGIKFPIEDWKIIRKVHDMITTPTFERTHFKAESEPQRVTEIENCNTSNSLLTPVIKEICSLTLQSIAASLAKEGHSLEYKSYPTLIDNCLQGLEPIIQQQILKVFEMLFSELRKHHPTMNILKELSDKAPNHPMSMVFDYLLKFLVTQISQNDKFLCHRFGDFKVTLAKGFLSKLRIVLDCILNRKVGIILLQECVSFVYRKIVQKFVTFLREEELRTHGNSTSYKVKCEICSGEFFKK